MKVTSLSTAAVVVSIFGVGIVAAFGDTNPAPPDAAPRGLQTIPVPEPANLASFVADENAAIQLGKALFWDMQLGSDSMTACATCHFQAGADPRSMNQMNPAADGKFQFGPNYHISASIFPLRRLSDPTDRGSDPAQDINDVVSSQGIGNTVFVSIIPGTPFEVVTRPFDPVFSVQGLNVRRVEPRHTPTVINAVFNHRNFWDGRAQNEFNGVNNWGDRDPDARVYRAATAKTPPLPVRLADDPKLHLTNASLASQAVAPIMSTVEMAASGRDTADIGSKLNRLRGKKASLMRPLGLQLVAKDDSVLGKISAWPDRGLTHADYGAMIKKAFRREWWDSTYALRVNDDGSVTPFTPKKGDLGDNEYSLLEYNFSLFFGLAIQLYEATLVADDTPYDRWRERKPGSTISPQAFAGLQVFLSQDRPLLDANGNPIPGTGIAEGARCVNCHAGPAFTDASVFTIGNPDPTNGTVRRKREGQEIDRGFNNIGVRSTLDDLGVGGKDKFGNPLSLTATCRLNGGVGSADSPCPPSATTFIAADGAFKVPGLRNVELTPPYFHNGGHLTLESVVDFYSRGGDFGCSGKLIQDPVCAAPAGSTITPQPLRAADGTEIRPLGIPGYSQPTTGRPQGLSQSDKDALVAFLKTLTDERVRLQKAPFDHPQLFVPHGQLNDDMTAIANPLMPGQAMDRFREIPAVGKNGGTPVKTFLTFQ